MWSKMCYVEKCGEISCKLLQYQFCRNVRCFVAKYVLSRNMFCRDLRLFMWRKIEPEIVLVEKKIQISGMPPGFISPQALQIHLNICTKPTTNWMPGKKAPRGMICKVNCKRFVCWFQKCSCMKKQTKCNIHSWQMCQHRLCSQPRCRWSLRIQFRDFKCLLKPPMFNTESFEHSEQAQDWRKGVACILYHYQLHFIFNWFKHLKVICKFLLCSNRWSIKVYCNNRSVQLKDIEMGLTISILDHVYCPNFWLISHYILVITNIWQSRMFSGGMDLTFVFVCCRSNNGVRLVGGPDYPGSRPQLNPTGGLRCSSPLAFKTGDMRFADNSGQLWVSCWDDCVPTSFGRKEGWCRLAAAFALNLMS